MWAVLRRKVRPLLHACLELAFNRTTDRFQLPLREVSMKRFTPDTCVYTAAVRFQQEQAQPIHSGLLKGRFWDSRVYRLDRNECAQKKAATNHGFGLWQ